VHVVAGVVLDVDERVLIARRPRGSRQGGLWEFPGGKRESAETAIAALTRELGEEIGITIRRARPLIRLLHRYPDRHVDLDAWRVDRWEGDAFGREGQELKWVARDRIHDFDLLPANRPIIASLSLPDLYMITPDPAGYRQEEFLKRIAVCLDAGVRLIQLRAKALDDDVAAELVGGLRPLCEAHGASLLVNAPPGAASVAGAHGVHLSSPRLMSLSGRPLGPDRLIGASCHDLRELLHAQDNGVDFAVLGPVCDTASHDAAVPLGWERFAALVASVRIPVYAIGGLTANDASRACWAGARGLAMISGIWSADDPRAVVNACREPSVVR
jgi:8-oxo-dGTP diphosphatase